MDRVAVIGDSAGSNSLTGRPMRVWQNDNGRYWISVFPGVVLLLTILAINLVADRLRDVLNPRRQER